MKKQMRNIQTRMIITGICLALVLILVNCKQDFLRGVKTASDGKVYLPAVAGQSGLIAGLVSGQLHIDTAEKTADFSIAVFRGGFGDTSTFNVTAGENADQIGALVASGALPANTVALAPADYTLETTIAVTYQDGMMQGRLQPKVKIGALDAYTGKTAAIALELKSSTRFAISDTMRKVVLYFNVDSLLDEAIPPTNLIDPGGWQILHITDNDNVLFTVQPDGSVLATGGNNGHQGVFQSVEVQAGKNYTIDLHVKGSGATDTWYEVYVAEKKPVQGTDYTNDPDYINRLALNTWAGCGNSPFDGLLSRISCAGSGNLVHFDQAGTVYIVIKCGGGNLGSTGILASDIDFRRVQ